MDAASPLWGVCSFDKFSGRLIECRAVSRLPENAESIIVACFPYYLGKDAYENSNISKYAVVTDYHTVAINRLEEACRKLREIYPCEEFSPFADNSPVPEVSAAVEAGLGVRGMNSLLITQKYGSFVFIGEIVTTLRIDPSVSEQKSCLQCGMCVRKCPANALDGISVDETKCLSAVTQKKASLTESEIALMKECGCVWGCDVCQDVCPMNKNIPVTEMEEFLCNPVAVLTNETSLEGRAYAWRGKKVTERNLAVINYED